MNERRLREAMKELAEEVRVERPPVDLRRRATRRLVRNCLVVLSCIVGLGSAFPVAARLGDDQQKPAAPSPGPRLDDQIAFLSTRGGVANGVFSVRSDGSNLGPLTEQRIESASLTWHSMGNRLAYNVSGGPEGSTIEILHVPTGASREILGEHDLEYIRLSPQALSWSPSGSMIAFTSSSGGLFQMSTDGSHLSPIPSNGQLSISCPTFDADWAPDGERIVVAQDCSGGGLSVLDIGDGMSRLTSEPRDDDPAWSPDGRFIAFTTGTTERQIAVIEIATGERRVLTEGFDSYDPDWSPDGSMIVFASNRSGQEDLYVMRADGHGERRITNDAASESSPQWRPSG